MACRVARATAQRLASAPEAACAVCGGVRPLLFRAGAWRVCSQRCRQSSYNAVLERGHPRLKHPERLRPAEQTCAECARVFAPKRYDQRFCSSPCNDRWHSAHGRKADTRRAKAQAEQEARWKAIGRCALCGTATDQLRPRTEFGATTWRGWGLYQRDHVLPRSHGGDDSPENLRWLCWFCNVTRQNIDGAHDRLIAAAGRAFWEAHRKRS